jgi:hypothetical protein
MRGELWKAAGWLRSRAVYEIKSEFAILLLHMQQEICRNLPIFEVSHRRAIMDSWREFVACRTSHQ